MSKWSLKSLLFTIFLLPLLSSCGDDITTEVTDGSDQVTPAVVGAVATSNTRVYVSFSKPMGDSAAVVDNYVITQENVNPEVGTLIIYDVYFPEGDSEHTAVILETSPQNEVTYRVSTSGIKDAEGNAIPGIIETLGGIVNTASVTFPGTAPTPIQVTLTVDSSGNITGWFDFNGNSQIDAGDTLRSADGINVVLADADGNGEVDSWVDVDGSGTFSAGDIVSGFQDSDRDGIADNRELYGESVFIEQANGEVTVVSVTSDPTRADTDGDGLSDAEEYGIGSNPRSTDTDADNIADYTEWNVVYSNPNAQDTDLDGLGDGLEHNFYHTSPILADSDGDRLSDAAELLELNRNPRIADIPKVKIRVGDVRLQIDERYSYTNEDGEVITSESSTTTSLSNSDSESFTSSDTHVDEYTGGGGFRAGVGSAGFFGGGGAEKPVPAAGLEVTGYGGYTGSNTWQTDRASSTEAQQAYENSLTKGRELSTTRTVTREVLGASIEVDVSVSNVSNVPFTLANLEITVLQQVGARDNYLPVATLVSNSELVTGTPLQVNLGGLATERGPFLFGSREVFPSLIEKLMRNPSGLVFRIANYDVLDELGRNYSFTNQVARDRTGNITFDYGDADAASQYLVATNGALHNGQYVGGFNGDNGEPIGLPLNYLLQSVLDIPRHDTAQDYIHAGDDGILQSSAGGNLQGDDVLEIAANRITAGANGWLETRPLVDDYIANPTSVSGIVAGLNKTADSVAQGDDIQRVPPGTTGLSIGTVVIEAGENGVLDTPNLDDDRVDFVAGYETSLTCHATSDKSGDICRVDADCQCQPGDTDYRCAASVTPVGACSGPQNLVRVKSLRNGDYNRAWFILTSGHLPDAADFDLITIEPGDNISLAFLQDLDNDGLFARHEFLYGSTDSSQDHFINAGFGENFNATANSGSDGIADSIDTDRDGLSDYAEAYVGWRVSADGGALRQVYSSPRFADSDGDGLEDSVEQDLRRFCAPADPRSDSLCAFQSNIVGLAEAIGIIAGADGVASSLADVNDEQLIPVGTAVTYGTPVVGPGADGVLTTALSGDDVYESAFSIPPASDPLSSDTDLDAISDHNELIGFSTYEVIVDGGDGIVDSTRNGDDIQRALTGNPVQPGAIITLSGANTVIDSVPGGDDYVRPPLTGLVTDPLRRDTDTDMYTDGFEVVLGSDPTVIDADDFTDQDLDGLTDNEETSLGWLVSIDGGVSFLVNSSPSLPDTDFDGLPDFVERDLRTNPNSRDTDGDGISDYDEINDLSKYAAIASLYPAMNISAGPTSGWGTNPTLPDTDGDGLSDRLELIDGFNLLIPGQSSAIHVYTNALEPDSDFDGLDDLAEKERVGGPTDPTVADTDGDGRTDGDEDNAGSNPYVPDRQISVRYTHLLLYAGGSLWDWSFHIKGPDEVYPGTEVSDGQAYLDNNLITQSDSCGNVALSSTPSGFGHTLRSYYLQAGDTITLNGEMRRYGLVTSPCSGTTDSAYFMKSFTYDEIVSGSVPLLGTFRSQTVLGSEQQDIGYEIIVE